MPNKNIEQKFHIKMTEEHPSQYHRINDKTLEKGVSTEITKDEFNSLLKYQKNRDIGKIFEITNDCSKCKVFKTVTKKVTKKRSPTPKSILFHEYYNKILTGQPPVIGE